MKKTLINIVSPKPGKTAEAVNNSLANGGCTGYYAAFCSEVASGRVKEYPAFFAVTDNYLCDFSKVSKRGVINIVPINSIVNLYRSNVVNGNFDFNSFYLAVELNNGSRLYCCGNTLKFKDALNSYAEIIKTIKASPAYTAAATEV